MKIWKGKSIKKLTLALKKSGGRSSRGRIAIRHSGGGHARRYRVIDFDRSAFLDNVGVVKRIEYDPSRTAAVALVLYDRGVLAYILAPTGVPAGKFIFNGVESDPNSGNSLPISHIPPGSLIHSLMFYPGLSSGVARAGGVCAQILRRFNDRYSLVKLPSGERRIFLSTLWATVGVALPISTLKLATSMKAGRSRWLGIRPKVRGVAMNPVDHPHGGGQGKTSGGRCSVTPWGYLTKGFVTKPKRFASPFVYKHRKTK